VFEHKNHILTSRCPDTLYLIAFFDDSKELRERAKECLNNLSLDTSKPPDVMHWGTQEVRVQGRVRLRAGGWAARPPASPPVHLISSLSLSLSLFRPPGAHVAVHFAQV
jgi:hypothetical protein